MSASLQRKHAELKESLEFSEAERAALLDSNTELESKLTTLGAELEESQCALKKAKYVLFVIESKQSSALVTSLNPF